MQISKFARTLLLGTLISCGCNENSSSTARLPKTSPENSSSTSNPPMTSEELKEMSDSELLDGEWKLIEAGVAGNTFDRSQDATPTTIRIQSGVLSEYVQGDFSTESHCKLDSTVEPKRIELTYTDETDVAEVGIYEMEGDSLTLCRCPVENGYPTDFSTTKGDSRTLQVFVRVQ